MSKVCPLCGKVQTYPLDAGFGCSSCERKHARQRFPTFPQVIGSVPLDADLMRLVQGQMLEYYESTPK